MRDMKSNIAKFKSDKTLADDFELSYLEVVNSFAKAMREEIKPFVESYNILKRAGGMDFVLAGYDKNAAKMFSVDVMDLATPFAPRECERYYISGVNEVGVYWTRKLNMNDLDLPIEFLKRFAVMVILETIKTDDMVGEPIQLAVVDKKGYHDITSEVDSIKPNLDSEHKWLFDYMKQWEK